MQTTQTMQTMQTMQTRCTRQVNHTIDLGRKGGCQPTADTATAICATTHTHTPYTDCTQREATRESFTRAAGLVGLPETNYYDCNLSMLT